MVKQSEHSLRSIAVWGVSDRPRFQGGGNTYVQFFEPIVARVGSTESALHPVGEVSQLIVDPAENIAIDTALMVFDGATPGQVLEQYRRLSPEEVQKLGHETMYMSGWPRQQLDTLAGQQRHDFALTILGTRVLDDGRNVLYAAMRRDERGAECSYGGSGSEGFVIRDGQPWSVGPLTAFNDVKPGGFDSAEVAGNTRKAYENWFGMSLATYDAVCGFAFEVSNPAEAQVLHISSSPPDPITPQASKRLYQENLERSTVGELLMRAEFFDARRPKTVLQGIVKMEMWKGSGFLDGLWVKNPVLLHDKVTGLSFLAGFHSRMPENLRLVPLGSQQVDVWSGVDRDGHEELPRFVTTTGKTELGAYMDRATLSSFRDETGLEFAMTVGSRVSRGSSQGRLVSNNGVFEVRRG